MPLLRQGSKGPSVATLQAALNFYVPDLPPLAVDSSFGAKTEARVKEFQRRHKLVADGIVGPKTEAVIYACGSVRASAFAVRQTASSRQPRFSSLLPGRLSLLPPGGLTLPFQASTVHQLASPFQLPPLTLPPIPTFLPPSVATQLGAGQQVTWSPIASSWEFWSTDLMVLSRKLEIKASIEPEQSKMGSVPGWDINVVGSAKWTLLPERLRRPSFFLQAGAKTAIPPDGVTGSGGLGIDFRGNTLILNFEGNSAFDVDPQGRAGTDLKVPEGNFRLLFEKRF